MSRHEPNCPAPSLDRRKPFIDRVDSAAAIAAHRQTFIEAIDASLSGLREECLRTMALVHRQRTSRLYRRSSAGPRFATGR